VVVKGQGIVSIDRLQIGDEVKVGGGSFSEVYSFSHKQESVEGTYLQIHSEAMDNVHPIEITGNHLIYVFDQISKSRKLVFAQDVKVGDFLVTAHDTPALVKSIHTITKNKGLYTPITTSGDILVNGVLVSSYTSVDCFDGFLSTQMLHWLSHGTMAPYRVYCAFTGGCQDESYDEKEGLNPWIKFLSEVQHTLLDSSSSFLAKALIVMESVIPFVLFVVLGKLIATPALTVWVHVVVLVLGYYSWKKTTKKDSTKANPM